MIETVRNVQEPNRHSFPPITADDQAGYIWVTALYCIIFSSLVLITRAWIKRFSWGQDDIVFSAAFAAQIGHVVAIFVALKHGLGRVPRARTDSSPTLRNPMNDVAQFSIGGKAAFSAMIFLIVFLALTKISLLLFMRRLMTSQSRQVSRLSYVLIGLSTLWATASIIALGADCSPSGLISDESAMECKDLDRKWIGIATVDALSELIIITVPIAIVWPLKMSKGLKFQACFAFMFRIGVIIAAAIHAIYVSRYESAEHPSVTMVPAIIAAEAELCWSLVSATIPSLKNFMKSFATGFGHESGAGIDAWPDRARVVPKPSRRRIGSSIPLGRIGKKIWHAERPGDFVSDSQTGVTYATDVQTGHEEEMLSRTSGKSKEFIIRKDVTLTVDRGQKFGNKLR